MALYGPGGYMAPSSLCHAPIGSWNLCLGLVHDTDYVKTLLSTHKLDILNPQESELLNMNATIKYVFRLKFKYIKPKKHWHIIFFCIFYLFNLNIFKLQVPITK